MVRSEEQIREHITFWEEEIKRIKQDGEDRKLREDYMEWEGEVNQRDFVIAVTAKDMLRWVLGE